jgi:DMSO reductase anchor subunit
MTPKSYNILGWFLFTVALLVFLAIVVKSQQPPTGNRQTMIWTVVGAVILYLFAGIYTFNKNPSVYQIDLE